MEGSNFIYEYPIELIDNYKMMPSEGVIVTVISSPCDKTPTTVEEIDAFVENGGTFMTFGISDDAYVSFCDKFFLNGKRMIPMILEYNKWKLDYDNQNH